MGFCEHHDMVTDLTDTFTSSDLRWDLRGRAFRAQFSDEVRAMKVGIYALHVVNDSDFDVCDRNGSRKVIIPARHSALKPGKFEGGLCDRERTTHEHYHRRTPDGEHSGIFVSTLRYLLVLDLTATRAAADKALLRTIETAWKRTVRARLSERGIDCAEQKGWSESRWIRGTPPTKAEVIEWMRELATAHSSAL